MHCLCGNAYRLRGSSKLLFQFHLITVCYQHIIFFRSPVLVDIPEYDQGDDAMKSIHVFATPQVCIVSGVSGVEFEVSPSEISKFFIGGFLRVHDVDFIVDSTPTLALDDLEIIDARSQMSAKPGAQVLYPGQLERLGPVDCFMPVANLLKSGLNAGNHQLVFPQFLFGRS